MFSLVISQLTEASQVGSELVRGASQYDANTFVLIVLICVLSVFGIIWLWKVYLPDREVKRQCEVKLTEAITHSSEIISRCHVITERIDGNTEKTGNKVHQLLAIAEAATAALEKLSHHAEVDVDSELGQIRGILRG